MATRRGNTMKNRQGVAALLGILALGAILAMIACGPSVDLTFLGDGGNADGTGIGPVTGFGSIKLAGAVFSEDNTTTIVDDEGRTTDHIIEGMVVTVQETLDQN